MSRGDKRRERKLKLVEMSGCVCEECGQSYPPECFDFHHIDPKEKEFTLNLSNMDLKWERIVAEWRKCIMLCANCHRTEHHREGRWLP